MSTSIRRILIANRGEIALRIIATCRDMNIAAISIFSGPDAALPHATLADESYPLGNGTLAETYLNQQKIIDIALAAKADAIHPGYGFLSENAVFAKAVTNAGLIFIGPPADVIKKMGDKMASREIAVTAGVPLIPGYNGQSQDAITLESEAQKIGFPVMIKASAGGGGKGMRRVDDARDFIAALAQAKSEAMNAFGDDRMFIEKYLVEPRHIEVQVMSDMHGTHLHLYERECSIQRRHQKIIEESPSVAIDEALREALTNTALKLCKSIGYVGAGTIEFMLDADGKFYFLEMNTRLQVEHPVTEMITQLDLVKLQIVVARGESLPITQADITRRGHAIECRICAEDPDHEFYPATGAITYIGNAISPFVRIDCGYRIGNDIGMHYDSLIAKVIAWGNTREEAVLRLIVALKQLPFAGVQTNREFILRILNHADFMAGATHTHFIESHAADLQKPAATASQEATAIAAYLLFHQPLKMSVTDTASPWSSNALRGFRNS